MLEVNWNMKINCDSYIFLLRNIWVISKSIAQLIKYKRCWTKLLHKCTRIKRMVTMLKQRILDRPLINSKRIFKQGGYIRWNSGIVRKRMTWIVLIKINFEHSMISGIRRLQTLIRRDKIWLKIWKQSTKPSLKV